MKTLLKRTLFLLGLLTNMIAAQEVIPLYSGAPPGSPQESYPEEEYFSKAWNEEVVTNVSRPSLIVFRPAPELRNGTAVVICSGGAFMALSIKNEGTDVARYMTAAGVTAFVLEYRLAHTGVDIVQQFSAVMADPHKRRLP
jgi:acetyl esterase/lipase